MGSARQRRATGVSRNHPTPSPMRIHLTHMYTLITSPGCGVQLFPFLSFYLLFVSSAPSAVWPLSALLLGMRFLPLLTFLFHFVLNYVSAAPFLPSLFPSSLGPTLFPPSSFFAEALTTRPCSLSVCFCTLLLTPFHPALLLALSHLDLSFCFCATHPSPSAFLLPPPPALLQMTLLRALSTHTGCNPNQTQAHSVPNQRHLVECLPLSIVRSPCGTLTFRCLASNSDNSTFTGLDATALLRSAHCF